MSELLEFEKEYWDKGLLVCGIDEAGRGPLAGPLVVAGCILPIGFDSDQINDSKKLTARKREELFDVVTDNALYYQIEIVEPDDIDKSNIYACTKEAMGKIAAELPAEIILTDAMPLNMDKTVIDIIKGDARSLSIAAASILAKVTRDRIMLEYDKIYPQYHFAKHKGYGTKEHLLALDQYGPCPIHRYSYAPVFKASQPKLDI